MQVAHQPAALAPRVAAGREIISQRADMVSASFMHVSARTSLTISEVKEVSPAGLWAIHYIADSTRLSREEKKTLIRLVAMVDEFAGGDPKLMKDIIGIAKIMEADTPEGTFRRHSFADTMEAYWRAREALDPSESVTISVETELTAVQVVAMSRSLDAVRTDGEF